MDILFIVKIIILKGSYSIIDVGVKKNAYIVTAKNTGLDFIETKKIKNKNPANRYEKFSYITVSENQAVNPKNISDVKFLLKFNIKNSFFLEK